MKRKLLTVIISSMLTLPTIGHSGSGFGEDPITKLRERVENLGSFLGFDIQNTPPESYINASDLIDKKALGNNRQNILTYIGAIPVVVLTQNTNASLFVPSSAGNISLINGLWNAAFQSPDVFLSPLMDQPPNQQDPVSQAILDIIGTPDDSFCKSDADSSDPCGDTLYMSQVTSNINGPLPAPQNFYKMAYPPTTLIPDLNVNSLLGPLLYNNQGNDSNSTSSPSAQGNKTGLTSASQLAQANNFIRYASGIVAPIPLPKMDVYSNLYFKATSESASDTQQEAQATLNNYLANLKVYTAQNSIGISNLYYLMAKRLPQKPLTPGTPPSSQAMDEFKMATWRLFSTEQDDKKPGWLDSLKDASPATVQKEIAALLAEINYQLYLNRMQDERILLTQSILLLQTARVTTKPNPNLSGVAQ